VAVVAALYIPHPGCHHLGTPADGNGHPEVGALLAQQAPGISRAGPSLRYGMTPRASTRLRPECSRRHETTAAPRGPETSSSPIALCFLRTSSERSGRSSIRVRSGAAESFPRVLTAIQSGDLQDLHAGGGTRTPDTRIMIPRDFGLAIGNSGPVGHAVGHNHAMGARDFAGPRASLLARRSQGAALKKGRERGTW
jgi:hypothetical protein